MPHFTLNVDVPGPVVNAVVSVSEARRGALIAQNLPVPHERVIRALVDTGASFTSIEPAVLVTGLELTPTGTIDVVTPSTGQGSHTADTYDVDFSIKGASQQDVPLSLTNIRVGASELFLMQGIHALIGRDVLQRCVLVYNGALNQFTLAF
jgi:hypothetical protein